MAQLVIKGHETRGNEVIEILEMLGGNNLYGYAADSNRFGFYIGEETRDIYYDWISSCYEDEGVIVFTLEEFLEKFPYKVGDKVLAYFDGTFTVFTIQDIRWNYELNRIEYKICSSWCDTSLMQPYQEELISIEERKYDDLRIDVDQVDKLATEATIDGDKIMPPKNYLIGKITKVDNGMLVEFVKKQQYPKIYEKCCDILQLEYTFELKDLTIDEEKLTDSFIHLKRCRDAYWKIAGEQMGLGKPWEPDWEEKDGGYRYCICNQSNKIVLITECLGENYILSFPSEEMRDAFYENFEELIKNCKELL